MKLAVTLVVALTVGLVVARLTIVPTVGPLRMGDGVLGAWVAPLAVVLADPLADPCPDEHPIAKPHASAARVSLLISLLRFFQERGGRPTRARTVTGA
ncbi:MAG TPA: hypothetical protein VFF73_39050 [Planctomycetota bacterium]|nr:hypothetical protein [Planctomycetota bacterium]